MLVSRLACLGEGSADAPEQQAPRRERGRVDHERDVASEARWRRRRRARPRRPASCPTASRSARSRSAGRVGSTRFGVAADDAGSNGAPKTESSASNGYASQIVSGADEQEREADPDAGQVADDHQLPPVEAVDEHPGGRRRQEERDLLRQDREADVDRPSRRLDDQRGDRHEQEPVAAERDHRRQEQPPEVPVAPEQRDAGSESGRRLELRVGAPSGPPAPDRARARSSSVRQTRHPSREEEAMLDHVTWFRQAALRWRDDERTIYIDPWGTGDDPPPADLIFITHAHFDHFRPDEIEKLRRAGTKLVAPRDVADELTGDVTPCARASGTRSPASRSRRCPRTTPARRRSGSTPRRTTGWATSWSSAARPTTTPATPTTCRSSTTCGPMSRSCRSGGTSRWTGAPRPASRGRWNRASRCPIHYGFVICSPADGLRFREAAAPVPVELIVPVDDFEQE